MQILNAFTGNSLAYEPWLIPGLRFLTIPLTKLLVKTITNSGGTRDMTDRMIKSMNGALVIVNSFWGWDRPHPVPPNYYLSGVLEFSTVQDNKESAQAALSADIEEFIVGSIDVIYISTGSMITPEPWLVRTIHDALKNTDHRIIWSLKEECQSFAEGGFATTFLVRSTKLGTTDCYHRA